MENNNGMCKHVKFTTEAVAADTVATVTAAAAAAGATAPTTAVAAPVAGAVAAVVVTEASASSASTTTSTATTTSNVNKNVHFKLAAVANAAEPEELLGSVTTQNCPGTRASARVIQKMKLDLTRPMTPPPPEREHNKKEEKGGQKTPSQMRAANKTTWTNVERNCFFDALNEFGKDFEAVSNCINTKLKRRNTNSDYSFKTKDQVRQHYYQTYHKIAKYVRYSDELKKPAQELYTLVNYGEMRRKLQFLTDKHFMKLKQLIYQGHIIVRCKGKNIRIKTPSCKALRRLNRLDDTLDDIRLPSKVEVLVSPANMEAFGHVQSLAQNPRGRAIVPLHKKLNSFIKTFQYKWRSADARLAEEQLPLVSGTTGSVAAPEPIAEPAICFLPKPGVTIHRPLLSITAYLSSVNICLSAYEERLGVKVRSETLNTTAVAAAASAKRARTESGSEKRSPESKKIKLSNAAQEKPLDELAEGSTTVKLETGSSDELTEEINELLGVKVTGETAEPSAAGNPTTPAPTVPAAAPPASASTPASAPAAAAASPLPAAEPAPTPVASSTMAATAAPTPPLAPTPTRAKREVGAGGGKNARAAAAARNFKPLLSDDVIKRIRKGWTISNSADISIGDLYVVLGQDSKLELEYFWYDTELTTPSSSTEVNTTISTSCPASPSTNSSASTSSTASTAMPYNTNDCDSVERVKAIASATVSNKLKHLLLVANLSDRVRKRQCSCGHSCDRKRDQINKTPRPSSLPSGPTRVVPRPAPIMGNATSTDGTEVVFRTPMLPIRRPIANFIDPVRQLSKLTRQKLSRQVLVQRCLLPPSSVSKPYDLLSLRNLHNGRFEPIERVSSSSSSDDIAKISFNSSERHHISASSDAGSSHNDDDINSSSGAAAGGLDMPNLDFCAEEPNALPATSTTLPEDVPEESNTATFYSGSVSPMHLLRDSTSNARWLEENINDFSLTSLLGHLDDFDATRDILDPSSSMSVISESSVDYRHKFQEISALLQQQEKD